ncbi:MAG: hypothetical protein HY719_00395 [Planctomycetes bacterium]|nr:hypothetical protein [Planctomycetota bacterium]
MAVDWFSGRGYRPRSRPRRARWVLRAAGYALAFLRHRAEEAASHAGPPAFTRRDLLRRAPRGHVARTAACVLDTMIPGPAGDPEQSPGALESGAFDFLTNAALLPRTPAGGVPQRVVNLSVTALALAVDAASYLMHGRRFRSLPRRWRERVLGRLYDLVPEFLEGAAAAAHVCFCLGFLSRAGLSYLGVPGPNEGLPRAPERPTPRGLTADGNPP